MNWKTCPSCEGWGLRNVNRITYTLSIHLQDRAFPRIFENVNEKQFQEFSAQFDKKHGSTDYIVLRTDEYEFRHLAWKIVGYVAEQEC